ncbi:MAG: M28 family peptidase, partial [Gemmatimonadetes bacterium]|nr:M28 family peptidase [Gemmatimonadota bacterium]
AHDNALGVAKVLASAEFLAKAPPRRSLLFLALGAEESGLLGALHYLKEPVFPLEATVASINHDGGLLGSRHDDVLAWGPSFSTVETDVEWAASVTGLTYNRERKPPFTPAAGLLHRSDHTPFLMAGIPSVYLMPGFSKGGDPAAGQAAWNAYLATVHHRQADNPDPSATYESALALTAMSVRLAWRLAQAEDMPTTHPDAPVAKSRQTPNGRFYNP